MPEGNRGNLIVRYPQCAESDTHIHAYRLAPGCGDTFGVVENKWEDTLAILKGAPLAVVECKAKGTGEPVYIVAAVGKPESGPVQVLPLARLFTSDCYAEIERPEGLPKIIAEI